MTETQTISTPDDDGETKTTNLPVPRRAKRIKMKTAKAKADKNIKNINRELKKIADKLPVLPMPVATEEFVKMTGEDYQNEFGEVEGMPDENIIPVPQFEILFITKELHYHDIKEMFHSAKTELEGTVAVQEYVKHVEKRDIECQELYPHLYDENKTTIFEEIEISE